MENAELKYELMIIISMDNGLQEAKKTLESIKKQLQADGKIFFEDVWGERDLAYTMKKQDKGFYAVYNFSFNPEKVSELETNLRLDTQVIRHLLIKVPFKYEPKSLADFEKEKVEADIEKETEKKA
ncbi:30S ribosomal protein S6 [Candidatus Peregrinibacteria bacterium]|nr:30S ribosomal protein S6 [Candidatus Peregrinibacteria bacterium]